MMFAARFVEQAVPSPKQVAHGLRVPKRRVNQAVIVLLYGMGVPSGEIAARYGISQDYVRGLWGKRERIIRECEGRRG